MQESTQKQSKSTIIQVIVLMISGIAAVSVLTFTPWNTTSLQVTQNVTVLAITERGCVAESEFGTIIVVVDCTAEIGDVILATFFVPATEQKAYQDNMEENLITISL